MQVLGILMVVLAGTMQPVRADNDLPIALFWDAPAGCPDEATLRQEIRGRLSSTARPVGSIAVHAVVTLLPGSIWQLDLRTQVEGHQGERAIRHADCARIAEAAALVIALLIDPNASPNASLVAPPRPPLPPPLPPPPPPPPLSPAELRIPRWAVGLDVLAGVGMVPGLSAGARLRLGWQKKHLGLHLRLGGWLEGTASSTELLGAGGTFSFSDLSGGPCLRTSPVGTLGLQACAGFALNRMQGVGFGISDPGSVTVWMLAYYLEGSLQYRATSRFVVRGLVEGALQPSRPAFAIRGLNHFYRPPLCSVKAGLGVDFLF